MHLDSVLVSRSIGMKASTRAFAACLPLLFDAAQVVVVGTANAAACQRCHLCTSLGELVDVAADVGALHGSTSDRPAD